MKEECAEEQSDKTDNGKNGNSSEYLYFDIASMPRSSFTKSLTLIIKEKGNTARSKNEDEPVTIIQWKYAETVNEEENYEFDDITDDEVDDEYILQKWQRRIKTLLDNSIDLICS